MSKSAQRTDTLAHIRPAGTQKVAHRVVQTKHGRLGDFGAKVPSTISLIHFQNGHGVRWEIAKIHPVTLVFPRSIP